MLLHAVTHAAISRLLYSFHNVWEAPHLPLGCEVAFGVSLTLDTVRPVRFLFLNHARSATHRSIGVVDLGSLSCGIPKGESHRSCLGFWADGTSVVSRIFASKRGMQPMAPRHRRRRELRPEDWGESADGLRGGRTGVVGDRKNRVFCS